MTGAASVLTLPVAVYLTRYVSSYDLIDSAYAIPVGALLGLAAVALARRARRARAISLGRESRDGLVSAGRILGIAGVCIALAGVVSLVVYGLLQYAGNRG